MKSVFWTEFTEFEVIKINIFLFKRAIFFKENNWTFVQTTFFNFVQPS